MNGIVEKMKKIPDLSAIKGCSDEQIREAEAALGIVFPKDYTDYVRAFGCIDFGATEWTGLNIRGRLNTVDATKAEMDVNKDFPPGFFVLENLGIDAQKVIVNQQGEVFLLQYEKVTPLCGSIPEYLDMCIKKNRG